jgi:CDP-diacylglycerol--glycerol-3-phosphate 3-phosphatidyltransferase
MTPAQRRRSGFTADLVSLPNLITLSRLILILIAAALFFSGHPSLGIALGIVAGVTDYVDGWLARRMGLVTRLGEILDQFCDVFYESMVLYIAIAQFHRLPLWVLPLYLGRELWVTTIRRFMAGHQLNIATNLVGKLKTNFVMWGCFPIYLSIAGAQPDLDPGLTYLGRASVGLGIFFGYLSAWGYTRQLVAGYDEVVALPASGVAISGDGGGPR